MQQCSGVRNTDYSGYLAILQSCTRAMSTYTTAPPAYNIAYHTEYIPPPLELTPGKIGSNAGIIRFLNLPKTMLTMVHHIDYYVLGKHGHH